MHGKAFKRRQKHDEMEHVARHRQNVGVFGDGLSPHSLGRIGIGVVLIRPQSCRAAARRRPAACAVFGQSSDGNPHQNRIGSKDGAFRSTSKLFLISSYIRMIPGTSLQSATCYLNRWLVNPHDWRNGKDNSEI